MAPQGKEALKALKVQKAVDKFSAASQAKAGAPASAALSAPPSTGPAPPPAAAGSRAPPPSGLPANFFSAPAGPSGRPAAPAAAPAQPAPAAQQPPARAAAAAPAPIVAAPRPAPPPTTQPAAAAAAGALPARFFEDKAADAKARGIKLPDAKDKEEEYREFQRMMDTQLREAAAKEAEEADAEAKEKEERDAFEFRYGDSCRAGCCRHGANGMPDSPAAACLPAADVRRECQYRRPRADYACVEVLAAVLACALGIRMQS